MAFSVKGCSVCVTPALLPGQQVWGGGTVAATTTPKWAVTKMREEWGVNGRVDGWGNKAPQRPCHTLRPLQ